MLRRPTNPFSQITMKFGRLAFAQKSCPSVCGIWQRNQKTEKVWGKALCILGNRNSLFTAATAGLGKGWGRTFQEERVRGGPWICAERGPELV